MNLDDIKQHFVEAARGYPCHICGSPYGFRVMFMGQCAHHDCVQRLCAGAKKEYNKHGAYEP